MPAIQPARLKLQVAELNRVFQQPEIFIKQLHGVLSLYTDQTHKPGQSGEPKPLMRAYNVPLPVIRQIMTELKPAIQANPIIAMNLCDMLWQQPYWETRYLATTILGQVVDKDFTPVMDRLTAWLSDGPEDQLVSLILENATNQLRRNQPDRVFDWIKKLLVSPKKYDPNIALRLLTTMVRDNSPENYPTIFKLINPLLREVPPALRQDLLELVSELAHRSPGEMAYILQTYLKNEDNSDTAWIIRQTLVDFPPSQQETLRAVLRSL